MSHRANVSEPGARTELIELLEVMGELTSVTPFWPRSGRSELPLLKWEQMPGNTQVIRALRSAIVTTTVDYPDIPRWQS